MLISINIPYLSDNNSLFVLSAQSTEFIFYFTLINFIVIAVELLSHFFEGHTLNIIIDFLFLYLSWLAYF